MNNSEKNVWNVCSAVFSINKLIRNVSQINVIQNYQEYYCEHAPTLERAVGSFPCLTFLYASEKKKCHQLRHLWLVKASNLTVFPTSLN